MQIDFYKYQGTGNDFIIIDNRSKSFDTSNSKLIQNLCDRKFGIGADGLIALENTPDFDFKMLYFNADGNEGSMCGNGGRCIVDFAKYLGIIQNEAYFLAVDGAHKAQINEGIVSLQMQNIEHIKITDNFVYLDTGSPHHISFQNNIDLLNVKQKGNAIRYGAPYFETGTNVNFVEQIDNNTFKIRTYERGVEDETLSCGTGVTAVAIAGHKTGKTTATSINIQTKGGVLNVSFDETNGIYSKVFLNGPAVQVFKGTITI